MRDILFPPGIRKMDTILGFEHEEKIFGGEPFSLFARFHDIESKNKYMKKIGKAGYEMREIEGIGERCHNVTTRGFCYGDGYIPNLLVYGRKK